MNNHLSPASASEHSYASSSQMGSSPAPSHHSIATTVSTSSSHTPDRKGLANGHALINNSPSPAGSSKSHTESPVGDSPVAQDSKPIICRWDNCGKTFYDPEVVYKHLCDDHVGRKSTNNLCLTCKWEGCDVSCAKRDHITSHLRVHTPLKPHACEVCNKTFKRPQDLKKHERIHTEEHQLQRQNKAAQGAAQRAYGASPEAAMYGGYLAANQAAGASHRMASHFGYPYQGHEHGFGGHYHGHTYPSSYSSTPQHVRDHTPGYTHSSASTASLSPLSSRLETPQGNSPLYPQIAPPSVTNKDNYLNLVSGESRPKPANDPNSYLYLAHGASNLAGTKRGHDQVAVGEFFGDVRRKKMAPTYDPTMAERLSHTFGGGIDDASLQAFLGSLDPSHGQHSAGLGGQVPTSMSSNPAPAHHQHGKMSLSEAFKHTDLAELNAFLLQLGANAARESIHSSTHATVGHGPPVNSAAASFDINTLSQYGLTNIPGFDESLLAGSNNNSSQHSHGGYSSASTGGGLQNMPTQQRPMAQLPSRQANSSLPHHHLHHAPSYGPSYGSSVADSPFQHLNNGSGYTGLGGAPQTSFDSLRVSRGADLVPQLAPMEIGGHSYRRVEALTRAAPTLASEPELSEPRPAGKHAAAEDDNEDEEMTDISPKPQPRRLASMEASLSNSSSASSMGRHRSESPAASSESGTSISTEAAERHESSSPSLGLYPRISSMDPSRRLPSPVLPGGKSRSGPSISSILSSEPLSRSRLSSQSRESSSPPPRLAPIRQASTSSESSPSMYPSLVDEVARLEGLGRPASRSGSVKGDQSPAGAAPIPDDVRAHHIRLIRDLLIAINMPRKIVESKAETGADDEETSGPHPCDEDEDEDGEEASRIRLAPIRIDPDAGKSANLEYEDGEKTPSLPSRQRRIDPDSDEEEEKDELDDDDEDDDAQDSDRHPPFYPLTCSSSSRRDDPHRAWTPTKSRESRPCSSRSSPAAPTPPSLYPKLGGATRLPAISSLLNEVDRDFRRTNPTSFAMTTFENREMDCDV
ncbi:hypothetical protein IE53DRAFT_338446 [Violaceomyces palustris]|uniref:Uncharacterized protein n=1 Tax=Violaceomyces palustris TaxID=1673888 RepID=A0ACD0P6E9_9BASI|nr:hypothetical protein IE53DRAFT_338446 [Violaceomyces palustris]